MYVTEFTIHVKNGVRLESYVMDSRNLEKHVVSLKEEQALQEEQRLAVLNSKLEAGEAPAKKSRRRTVEVAS
jgi:hypothetical protein